MTNEELVLLAKQGDINATYTLWNNVEKLIYMLCFRKYKSLDSKYLRQCGVTLEDFTQESYIAFTKAIKSYNSDKPYKFTSYISLQLKLAFSELLGTRTDKIEPLNYSSSLNIPIGEDTEIELLDTLKDDTIQSDFESIIDKEYNKQLHNALDEAMKSQCTKQEYDVINMRYYENKTQKDVSNVLGVNGSYIRQLERKAYKNLRYGKAVKILTPYRIESLAYSLNSSFGAWKQLGSVQERIIEKLEDYNEKR